MGTYSDLFQIQPGKIYFLYSMQQEVLTTLLQGRLKGASKVRYVSSVRCSVKVHNSPGFNSGRKPIRFLAMAIPTRIPSPVALVNRLICFQ